MKKLLALLLPLVMTITLLAGCSNPVFDDLQNFLNVEMVEVNAEYEALKEEVAAWETLEDDAALAASINEVLLPLVESSLTKLAAISPATEEVKELKAKYIKVMDAYKTGFTGLSEGCETQNEATINAAYDTLSGAVDLLNEYNAALEAVAAEVGAEIEY
ncbi:MAG: hypothetical protein E7471_05835 [Ruminococcaceae bacterium]|nr:hypothetical protein [Oscillospiraceae bacterium]